ncbi:MAG: aminotransferase class III-fold pyridoxal phosphate-dependent enzyme [Armatimonadota bacterium]
MSEFLISTFEALPFSIERGEGVYVFDEAGNRYLDMYGGHAVALMGHCPAPIINAIDAQSRKLFFYSNVAETSIRSEAADALASIVHPCLRNFFFCNSGAEANENALKLAIRMTGRELVASYKGSFHGRSLLCTAVSDNAKTNIELGNWIGNRVSFLSPNDYAGLDRLTEEFACVILEPIQSMAGMVEFAQDYLLKLREVCSNKGILLIFDEVQSGFGRTGEFYISGYSGIEPDMMTSAKGIASGYPVGLLAVSDAVKDEISMGDLGSTYGGGPVAMAAVKATCDMLQDGSLLTNVKSIDVLMQDLLAVDGVEEVRGRGCLIGLKTRVPAKDLRDRLLTEKIITGTSKDPMVLRLLPPITLSEEHMIEFRANLEKCLR